MLKDKKVYCNDTVENICKGLEGSLFEAAVEERALPEWEEQYQIVSRRREGSAIILRFVSRQAEAGWKPVIPGLEDVFLSLYR